MSHSKGSGDSDMSENKQLGLASGAVRSKDLGLPLRRSSRLRNRNKTDIEDLDDGLVADDEESRPPGRQDERKKRRGYRSDGEFSYSRRMGVFPHNGAIGRSRGEQQTVPTHRTFTDVIGSVNMLTNVVTAPSGNTTRFSWNPSGETTWMSNTTMPNLAPYRDPLANIRPWISETRSETPFGIVRAGTVDHGVSNFGHIGDRQIDERLYGRPLNEQRVERRQEPIETDRDATSIRHHV